MGWRKQRKIGQSIRLLHPRQSPTKESREVRVYGEGSLLDQSTNQVSHFWVAAQNAARGENKEDDWRKLRTCLLPKGGFSLPPLRHKACTFNPQNLGKAEGSRGQKPRLYTNHLPHFQDGIPWTQLAVHAQYVSCSKLRAFPGGFRFAFPERLPENGLSAPLGLFMHPPASL